MKRAWYEKIFLFIFLLLLLCCFNTKPAEAVDDASLSNLTVNGGELKAVFDPLITDYNAVISPRTFTVTAVPLDPGAEVTVDGRLVDNYYTSPTIDMPTNSPTRGVTIKVSVGSSTKIYHINVTSTADSSYLSNLSISEGELSPNFVKDTVGYKASTDAASVIITATPEGLGDASVFINGQDVSNNGYASNPIDLQIGANRIEVEVCAGRSGQFKKKYFIMVTRTKSNNTYLSNLSLNNETIPNFSPNTVHYSVAVTVPNITVTAVPQDSITTVTVQNQTLSRDNGYVSKPIDLHEGYNRIEVRVSIPGGSTIYYIDVTRKSDEQSADLYDLRFSDGKLEPSFTKNELLYNLSVDASSITVTAIPESDAVIVRVNGQIAKKAYGYISNPIQIKAGSSNKIVIEISTREGKKKYYYIDVVRQGPATAYLSSLTIKDALLNPRFKKTTNSYSTRIDGNSSSIIVTAVPENKNAIVTVAGQVLSKSNSWVSQPISLYSDLSLIGIEVLSGGITKKYTVEVTWNELNSADLSSLSISEGALGPIFKKSLTSYEVNVSANTSSIYVTAVPEDSQAVVTVNGQTLSGSHVSRPIHLISGSNRIEIRVEVAAFTKTYYINATRGSTNNAYLSSLSISGAKLSPSFKQTRTEYDAYVYGNTSYLAISAIPQDSNSTVTIEGQTGTSQTIYLGSGTTRIDIQVHNPSYGYNYYYIDVMQNGYDDENSYLSSLYINGAALEQSFYPSKKSYTATSSASSVTVTAVPEDSKFRVTVEGETLDYYDHESQSIYLSKGVNRIDIQVYNPNSGGCTNYYVDITRSGGGYGTIETNSATNIGSQSATLNARIYSGNNRYVEAYGFSYSTDQAEWRMVTVGNGDYTGSFSKVLKNLQPNTRYYYKAFTLNNYDYTYGSIISFYTSSTNQGIEVPIINVNTPNTGISFWDVSSSHWAFSHISNLVRMGYMTGYPDSSFHPGTGMSRAEVAGVMTEILRIDSYDTSTSHFYDVAFSDWYYASVEKVYQQGIMSGQGDYFSPNRATTREELAEVLVKALGKQSEAESNMYEDTGFYDDSSITSSVKGYVVTAVKYGLITGYNNRFNPQNSVTRAEVSAMLTTFLNKYR